jgi:putative redox protein
MLTSKIVYLGHLRTEATHTRSGQQFITDAPLDNKGMGEAFSPTDLTATSLAACAVTTMGIAAQDKDIEIIKMEAETQKVMAANPRRIAGIQITVSMRISPDTAENREMLERVGTTCPVALSLHPDLKQSITFHYV